MKKMILSAVLLMSVYIVSAQVDSLQQYTGSYKFPEGGPVTTVTVTIENGGLYATSEAGNSPLTRIDADVYSVDAFSAVATFKRNTDRKVTGIKIETDELVLEGTKTDPAGVFAECYVFAK